MTDANRATAQSGGTQTPTSNPVLRKALFWGAAIAGIILLGGALVGFLVAGTTGLVSALVGTAMAVVFMAITGASILFANRFASSDLFVGAFFGIVLGGWILKFIVFIVAVVLLKDASWVDTTVMFLSIVAGVLGSLVVDVIVVSTTRMPYASDVKLPRAPSDD